MTVFFVKIFVELLSFHILPSKFQQSTTNFFSIRQKLLPLQSLKFQKKSTNPKYERI
jgi:hypothetical protein